MCLRMHACMEWSKISTVIMYLHDVMYRAKYCEVLYCHTCLVNEVQMKFSIH